MFYRDAILLTLLSAIIFAMSTTGQTHRPAFPGILATRNEPVEGIEGEKLMADSANPGFVQRATARVYSIFERMRKALTKFIAKFLLYYSKALLRRAEGDQRGGGGSLAPQNTYHELAASFGPDFKYRIKNTAQVGGDNSPDASRGNTIDSQENGELPGSSLRLRAAPTPSVKRENTRVRDVSTGSAQSLDTMGPREAVNWTPTFIRNAVGPIQDVGHLKFQTYERKGVKSNEQHIATTTPTENLRYSGDLENSNTETLRFPDNLRNVPNAPLHNTDGEDVSIELVKLEYVQPDPENYTSVTEKSVTDEINRYPTQASKERIPTSSDLSIRQSVEIAKGSNGKEFVIVVDPNLKYADYSSGKGVDSVREGFENFKTNQEEGPGSILRVTQAQVPITGEREKLQFAITSKESETGENFGDAANYPLGGNVINAGRQVTNLGTFPPTFFSFPAQYPVPVYVGSFTKPVGGQVKVDGSTLSDKDAGGTTHLPGHFLFGGKISSSPAYLDFASQIPGHGNPSAQTVNQRPEQGNNPANSAVNTHPVSYAAEGGSAPDSSTTNYQHLAQNTPYFLISPSPNNQYRVEVINSQYQSDSPDLGPINANDPTNTGIYKPLLNKAYPEATPDQGLLVIAATRGGHKSADLQYGQTASSSPSTSIQAIRNINTLGDQ